MQDADIVVGERNRAGQRIGLFSAFEHDHLKSALGQQQRGNLSDRSGSHDEDVAVWGMVDGGGVVVGGHPRGPR